MRSFLYAGIGTMFTFSMTALGAAAVFFFRDRISERAQRLTMGFAGGVMSAAAVFSLLVPASEQALALGMTPWLVNSLGVLLGAGMIALLDLALRRLRAVRLAGEAQRRTAMMIAAVTLHNIPEGVAVGLSFAMAARSGGPALAAAAAFALGVGLQNIPEGAAVALPLRQSGMSRRRSFVWGALSGVAEPLCGAAAVLLCGAVEALLPGMMAFAAGAMLLVTFAEMIPLAGGGRDGVAAAVLGYVLMMALDIGLG